MLPNLSGKVINTGQAVNRGHPLATAGLIGAYRMMPPFHTLGTVRDAIGTSDCTLTNNCRVYGPSMQVRGSSLRQSSGQNPRIASTIWSQITDQITVGFWAFSNSYPNGAIVDTVTRQTTFIASTSTTCRIYHGTVDTGTITLNRTLIANTWYRILYGVNAAGAVTVWINGTQAGTDSVGAVVLSGGEAIDWCNNASGGHSNFNGYVGDMFIWNRKLDDQYAAMDYQEALLEYPGLFPKFSIWNHAPSPNPSATATIGDIGTITLTAPTVSMFANTDATATIGTIGTITLTAPTITASGGSTATIGTIGTITLTAPTITMNPVDNTATIGDIGTIYLFAPTILPYGPLFAIGLQQQYFWGRFARGQSINIMWSPELVPDDVATVEIWLEGTTSVREFTIPILDDEEYVFGMPMFLDNELDDGHYCAVIKFLYNTTQFCNICYFEVRGGTGTAPVISLLELERSLGRGVVMAKADGDVKLGYTPGLAAFDLE